MEFRIYDLEFKRFNDHSCYFYLQIQKPTKMKSTKIWYWIFTGLLVALMTFSSIPNVMVNQASIDFFRHLGYPAYLIPFLGVAKLLGVIALLVPGYPRIKEWAYAGFTFDLLGATYSGIMIGDPMGGVLFMAFFLGLIAGSYYFYHKRLRERGAPAMSAAQAV